MQTKTSLYGKLYQTGQNKFSTNNIPRYTCHVSSRRDSKTREFRIRIMGAQLKPHKPIMIQSITKTTMYYSKFRVRPVESSNSVLIWFKIVVEQQHFEPIRYYYVHSNR